jgi:acyl-coenzyme A synthetase/AMP-(fatty) acid ligase
VIEHVEETRALVARACRILASHGLIEGILGHVSARAGDDAFAHELQEFTRTLLAQHEYPRRVAFVSALPKTPAGKINRKALRDALDP